VGVVEVGEDAGTALQVVALVASKTVAGRVRRGALVRDGHTDLVGVEEPSLGAGEADLIVPVPSTASGIGGVGVVGGREDTGTVLEVIALEAGEAGTIAVVGSALVRDRGADFVGVENPSVGAGEADLVVPVPSTAAGVSGVGVVE
jgi:hypothetical protein